MRALVVLAAHAATVYPGWSFAASNEEILDAVNAVRMQGCDGRPGVAVPLREHPHMTEAARRTAQDLPYQEALASVGYRATRSVLIRMRGDPAARTVAGVVAGRSCANLADPSLSEIGIHQRARDTWIILAVPFSPPPAASAQAVARRVLELVNAKRGQPRMCGDQSYPAAAPVIMNATLNSVASAHASDMARHNYFAHEGLDGSTPPERVARAGYRWRAVGENIAAGQMTAEAVVEGWLKSPPHCGTLMGPQFTEMGVAYAVDQSSKAGIYWTQLFGRPR